MLESDTITGAEKRALVDSVVEKVICQKDGADICFRPETFVAEADMLASRSTFHTTCVVCTIDSRQETWTAGA